MRSKRFFFLLFFLPQPRKLDPNLFFFFKPPPPQKQKNTSDAIEACKNLPPEDEAACMLALGCDAQAVHARLDAEEEEEAKKKAAELAAKK